MTATSYSKDENQSHTVIPPTTSSLLLWSVLDNDTHCCILLHTPIDQRSKPLISNITVTLRSFFGNVQKSRHRAPQFWHSASVWRPPRGILTSCLGLSSTEICNIPVSPHSHGSVPRSQAWMPRSHSDLPADSSCSEIFHFTSAAVAVDFGHMTALGSASSSAL